MPDIPSLHDLIPSLAPYLNGNGRNQDPSSDPSAPSDSLSPLGGERVGDRGRGSDSSFIPHPSSFPQTGPKSPDGKSASRLNSLKHGLDATDRVFLSCLNENEQEAYKQIRRALRKFYGGAATACELMLIDRMAIQHLRMLRLYRLEAEVMEFCPRPGDKWSVIPHLDRFSRYDVRIEKQLRTLHNRLLSVFQQNTENKFKPFTAME